MKRKSKRFGLWAIGSAVALLFAGGCSHYHAGSAEKMPFNSLYVAPIKNESFAPQIHALLNDQLIQTLQQEGLLELENLQDAEAELFVIVDKYTRSTSTTVSDDTDRADSVTLSLRARCYLKNIETGEVYLDDFQVSADTQAYIGGTSAIEAEYQTMPSLTQKLAYKIRDQVYSVW